jgi:hypothetical protein
MRAGFVLRLGMVSLLFLAACSSGDDDDDDDGVGDVIDANDVLPPADANDDDPADANDGEACAAPGAVGNENGVGEYCTPGGGECGDNSVATLCTVDFERGVPPFCTNLCFGDTCGTDASCTNDGGGPMGCVPSCVTDR